MGTVCAVEVTSLRRSFPQRRGPDRIGLDGLSLEIPQGEVHGLLGPNGAGKTTLCKILSTVLLPTSGSAMVLGRDVVADARWVRPQIGIVFGGERGLYPRLTAEQNLRYWASLYKLSNREAAELSRWLLERVGLSGQSGQRVETFSRGMKQRLHLARGLVGSPRLLILDEPTTGMDPVAARAFRVLVNELREEGRTVLLTTHDMAEAESVCDRVSLIDQGRLIATENPRTIGTWLTAYERVVAEAVPAEVVARVRGLPGVVSVQIRNGEVIVEAGAHGVAANVLRLLVDSGVTHVRTARPSLEEVYLQVIGDRGMSTR